MENKFYNIVKRAYNSNELLLLLSADEAYIRGNDWIKPDPRLSMGYDKDPINLFAICYQLEGLFLETGDANIKKSVEHSLLSMIKGTDAQQYFAITAFYAIYSEAVSEKRYALKDVAAKLRPAFSKYISENKQQLKNIKIYNCDDEEEGLYSLCKYYSKKIVGLGGKPFVIGG